MAQGLTPEMLARTVAAANAHRTGGGAVLELADAAEDAWLQVEAERRFS